MRFDRANRAARWLGAQSANVLHRLPPSWEHRVRVSRPFRVIQEVWDRGLRLASGPDPLSRAPLCVLPWIHAHIETTGDVRLCCVARSEPGRIGNVHQQSIVQIFGSPVMSGIRGEMLAGRWPEDCEACQNREELGIRSYRQSNNQNHSDHFRKLAAEGQAFPAKIRTIDIRLNNICNFKCRSCNGFASNRWFNEHNLIYPDNAIAVKYQGFDRLASFWQDFDQHILPDLEAVHLAGGEPLITDAHYRLLEKLIASGKTDVLLQYDTNLSFLKFKHWDVVELWRRFPNLEISLSLDGAGEQGEFIREGLDYGKWSANVRRIQRELPHAKRNLHFVVSIFNVIDFAAHYRAITEANFVDPSRITFTFLEWPRFMNAQVLKPEIKAQVTKELESLLQAEADLPGSVRAQIHALIEFLHEKDLYPMYGAEFADRTRLLDQSRNQNTASLFPVLESMLSH